MLFLDNINIENLAEFDNHELIIKGSDEKSGLLSFIAIHNTKLGPALGATRYWYYDSEKSALSDALRLSRLMTYKCAIAGVNYGGGKGVILANSRLPKSKSLIKSYAQQVHSLNGMFITGEDVGINHQDVQIMAAETSFVIGLSKKRKNTSFWTALGVLQAIHVGLESITGSPEVRGRSIAVKGLGKVGTELCKLLYEHGCKITVADIDQNRTKSLQMLLPKIKAVSSSEIHRQKVDIYSPCALGEEFNHNTIGQLNCKLVCGGANNQLSSRLDGTLLHKREILYIPDYLANSGGLLSVIDELENNGRSSQQKIKKKVIEIGQKVKKIIRLSNKQNQPTNDVTDQLAESILRKKESLTNHNG